MIHSTVSQSTGLQGTINYLFQDNDSKGEKRESIDLIRGDFNSMLVREKDMDGNTILHTTLDFTANENKNLSQQDKSDILDSFISQLAMGLPSPKRLTYAVVEHDKDTDKAHYHIVALREDNQTQKKYEPWVTQRNDIERFHAWNDVMTDKYHLENPDDIPKITSPMGKAKRRSKDNQDITDRINNEIETGFKAGKVNNRDDVIKLLEDKHQMKITRKNDYSVSFKNDDMKRAIKLDAFAFSAKFIDKASAVEYQSHRKKRPDPNIATDRLSELEAKMKAYHQGRYDKDSEIDNQFNKENKLLATFLESINKGNASAILDKFKSQLDNGINNIEKVELSLKDKIENADWKDSINAAKSFCAQGAHKEKELVEAASFIKNCDKFLENYEDYMATRHNDKPDGYEATDTEIEEDNKWIDMYDEVSDAINNLTDFDMSNDDDIDSYKNDDGEQSLKTNLQSLANELKTLENNIQQQETTLKKETTKESQKTTRRNQRSNSNRQAPKPVNIMAAVVAAWKAGEMETKRNDARNYSERRKTEAAADNKPALRPKKKKKKSKKDD